MNEKFILKISSDINAYSFDDKDSKIRCTFKNDSDSTIELGYLFFYITEREHNCWELFKKKEKTLERILSNEKIVCKPGEEKTLLEETLHNVFFGGKGLYWNWMCRDHPRSSSPLLIGFKKGYVEEVNFLARLTRILVGTNETWCYSNKLKLNILPKTAD